MKKNKLVIRFMALLFVFIMAPGTTMVMAAQDSTVIERTYNEYSEIKQSISVGGKEYQLKEHIEDIVEIDDTIEIVPFEYTEIKTVNNLTHKGVDYVKNFKANHYGFTGIATVSEIRYEIDTKNSVFNRTAEIEKVVKQGALHEAPDTEKYLDNYYYDEGTDNWLESYLPLVDMVKKDTEWNDTRYYEIELIGDYEGRFQLPVSGKICKFDEAVPGVSENYDDYMELLALEVGAYKIETAEWSGETRSENNLTRRKMKLSIKEKQVVYESLYRQTINLPNIIRYTAVITYSGTLYKEQVTENEPNTTYTVYYELAEDAPVVEVAKKSPPKAAPRKSGWPFIIGGAAIAAGTIVIITYFRNNRKNVIVYDEETGKVIDKRYFKPTDSNNFDSSGRMIIDLVKLSEISDEMKVLVKNTLFNQLGIDVDKVSADQFSIQTKFEANISAYFDEDYNVLIYVNSKQQGEIYDEN